MQEFLQVLRKMEIAGGVSEEKVRAAEQTLGVTFPPAYRHFLLEHGAAFGMGFQLAGLFAGSENKEAPPMWRDIVSATQGTRRYAPGVPHAWLRISDDGADLAFYLDANDAAAAPVIALGPGVDNHVVAASFEEFVVKMARDELDLPT